MRSARGTKKLLQRNSLNNIYFWRIAIQRHVVVANHVTGNPELYIPAMREQKIVQSMGH